MTVLGCRRWDQGAGCRPPSDTYTEGAIVAAWLKSSFPDDTLMMAGQRRETLQKVFDGWQTET
jgi:hypothetical protein